MSVYEARIIEEAIRVGEENASRMIAEKNRLRKAKAKVYRIRHKIENGQIIEALRVVYELIDELERKEEPVPQGPPHTWVHALHQVTGAFALGKLNEEDRKEMIATLKRVTSEMEDDQNWVQFQTSRRPYKASR